MSELYNLGSIVILKAGGPGVEEITEADLQDMVDAFAELRQDIPIYAGKTVGQDAVRVGNIASLAREGPILKANFEKLPKQVFSAIQNGWATTIKAGLAVGVKSNGGKYRYVLEYISYPEIDPTTIRGTYKEEAMPKSETEQLKEVEEGIKELAQGIKRYSQENARFFGESIEEEEEQKPAPKKYRNYAEAGEDLDRQIKKYMFDHPGEDYKEVMNRILDADAELKEAYAQGPAVDDPESLAKSYEQKIEKKKIPTADEREANQAVKKYQAGESLARMAEDIMKDHPEMKHYEAMQQAFKERPDLARAYNS